MKCYILIKKNELDLQPLTWEDINGILFVRKSIKKCIVMEHAVCWPRVNSSIYSHCCFCSYY